MADDQYTTSTNWWDSTSSSRNRFESGSSSSSSGINNSLGSFGWPTASSSSTMESVSVSDSSGGHHHDLQMIGLGLSSQAMEWNQAYLRGEKSESSFRSMLQDSSTNYQQETGLGSSQVQWRERVFPGVISGDSPMSEFKQMSRGFSLDQPQFSPHGSSSDSTVTCLGLQTSNFQMDSSSSAIYGSPSTMLQGLLVSDNQAQQMGGYPYGASYGVAGGTNELLNPWSKVPQFLRNSPPKQTPQGQLHFSNNAPFWNPSATSITDVRPSFFPASQPQFPASNFDEKPKQNISLEVRESSTTVAKKSGSTSEPAASATKRPRNEATSTLPAFKVRKEKMGDRITALQQLVSPFGKTDTASVLSEAIESIKFLHEQVTVLSTPYMKSGAPIHHQQSSDKSKDPEGQKQDLRSRGLCLVPISSTFPVTHETTVDFCFPTFGGTFR